MTYPTMVENLQKTNKVYSQLEFGNITKPDFRTSWGNGGSLAAVAAQMVLFGA